MKLQLALVAAALSLGSSVFASSTLKITEVHSTGSSNSTYQADWFELTNFGSTSVDLTGWRMDDNSGSFAGGSVALRGVSSIAPGQSIVFLEGGSSSSGDATLGSAFKSAWFGSNVPSTLTLGFYGGSGVGLSASSDQVNVYNSSNATPVAAVWFGSATSGFTFDNLAGLDGVTTQLTQLSVLGVNGAFKSVTGNEVGSPGQIPEPSTYAAIVGAVALAFSAYRRQRAAA